MSCYNYGTGKKRLRVIRQLLAVCNNKCYLCDGRLDLKTNAERVTIDHVISLFWGGKDKRENWAVVHKDCNNIKEVQGAKKIYTAMKGFLGVHRQKLKDDDISNLQKYAEELPGLFGISWRYIQKLYIEEKPEGMQKLQDLIDSFQIPAEKLNEYVLAQTEALARNHSTERNFISLVKNPRVWYNCNPGPVKDLEKHPYTFYYGNRFLRETKELSTHYSETRETAKKFVVELLIDILMSDYADFLLDEYEAPSQMAS